MTLDGIRGKRQETERYSPQTLKIQRLRLALILLTSLGLIELLISCWNQSLSLFVDASHVASDVGAIALSLLGVWMKQRAQKHLSKKTLRLEAIIACINSSSLLVISVGVIVVAVNRLQSHTVSESYDSAVLIVAIASCLINGYNAFWLKGCSHQDIHLKSALIHIFADMIGSLSLIFGIFAGKYFGLVGSDTIMSLFSASVIILVSIPLVIQSIANLGNNCLTDFCLCQSKRKDLEKILLPSLEHLIL